MKFWLTGFWLLILSLPSWAVELRVAVSANFKPVLETLSVRFEQQQGHKVLISSASTGVLFNQISRGAPFDVFLSADTKRPVELEKKNLVVKGSRQAYAMGLLVLWDNRKSETPMPLEQLNSWKGRLAMANPATAPYGLAAEQVLRKLGVWEDFQGRIIQGSSIQQAWQFVVSKNVELGLVALSQLSGDQLKQVTTIPDSFYEPIQQDLVVLSRSPNQKQAGDFIRFLLSDASQKHMTDHGYLGVSQK